MVHCQSGSRSAIAASLLLAGGFTRLANLTPDSLDGCRRGCRSSAARLLTPFERAAFRLVRRMNQGRWKRLWCWCGRQIGARWIDAFIGSRLEIHGLERIATASRERPLLLAANHRSFFDMYVVMSLLFRRTSGWRDIYFPVRGRFFYQSPLGVLVNFVGAWWAMYPPFFHTAGRRRFDQYAFRILADLCREGRRPADWLPP